MNKLFITSILLSNWYLAGPAELSPIIVKDFNSERYLVSVNQDDVETKISFGDDQKFIPSIESSKWKKEVWLSIEHPDKASVTSEKPTLEDGKLQLTIGTKTHRYYIDSNDHLEYEIELAEKPAGGVVVLDINFPDGLDFRYQGTLEDEWKECSLGLTLEEFLKQHHRPDNVVGSYAVYWKKRNGQYKIGKFCHIYAPYIKDAEGGKKKCSQLIDGKKWSIYLPDANYPVVLDPALGYTSQGATPHGAVGYAFGTLATMPAVDGTVTSFGLYVSARKQGQDGFKLAVVNTDQSGDPEGLTTVDQIEANIAATGLNDNLGTPAGGSLSAGTEYLIIYTGEHDDNDSYYDAGGNTPYYSGLTYGDEFPVAPAVWGAMTGTVPRDYSLWVNYSETGGGEVGQVIIITSN